MTVKSRLISAKNKVVKYVEDNPMEIGYYIGVAAAAIVCIAANHRAQKADAEAISNEWDAAEQRHQLRHGPDAITVRARDGRFGVFVGEPDEE